MSLVSLLLALAAGAGSGAQERPACAAVAPPAELADWAKRTPLAAAIDDAGAGAASLVPGRAADVALAPKVTWAAPPGKPAEAGTYSGLLTLDVAQPGRYRLALGRAAWVDVMEGGRVLSSVAHAHGPACSGVAKMVDYDLKPGRHLVQIAGAPEATLAVMAVRRS